MEYDLSAYRQAKEIVPALTLLVKRLAQIETELSVYKNFFAIDNVCRVIQDNKTILEIHLNHQMSILESKGAT